MIVGMIGLGGMGGAMAARLRDLDQNVIGFDTDEARMSALLARGGDTAKSARDVADRAEFVIACLPHEAASMSTAHGPDGVIHGTAIQTYIEMSTLGQEAMTQIAGTVQNEGIGFLDSPISGGPKRARDGALTAIVAGRPETRKSAETVLRMVAEHVFEIGDIPGQAQIAKLINNMLSITAFVASCEAISIGVKAGLDARKMVDVINVSTGRNSATLDKFPATILRRKFGNGGPLSIGVKDSELYLKLARSMQMPAFVGSSVANLFALIADQLGPETDYSNAIKVFEAWGGGIVVGDGEPDLSENQ